MQIHDVNSKEWADWLDSVAQHPHQHHFLTRVGGALEYLSVDERRNMQKAGFPVQVLKIEQIIEVTRQFWEEPSVNNEQKRQMLKGISYIHAQRHANYKGLFFVIRWFAKLKGVEGKLKEEKFALEQLENQLNKGQERQGPPILLRPVLVKDSPEKLLTDLNALRQKFLNLVEQRVDQEYETWCEAFFACERVLHEKKVSFSAGVLPDVDRSFRELEKSLDEWNAKMPRVKHIVKVFGHSSLRPSLRETLVNLLNEGKVTQEEIDKDQALFKCNQLEAHALCALRLIRAERTKLTLSLITAIERKWQELMESQNKDGVTKKLEGYRVIFLPTDREIYLKEAFIAKGTYKAAFLITAFNTLKREAQRCASVILQPVNAVTQDIEEAIEVKELEDNEEEAEKKSPSMTPQNLLDEESDGSRVKSWGDTVKINSHQDKQQENYIELVGPSPKLFPRVIDSMPKLPSASQDNIGEKEKEEYQMEAQNCLRYGNLAGIWPTEKVRIVDGNIALFQPRAGYPLTTVSGEEVVAISLADMGIIFREKELRKGDQLVLLKMIGHALIGVESLHKLRIMHRDLKTENILCSKEGQAGVSDLGTICEDQIPGADPDDPQWVHNPQKKGIVGSPHYIAPEVVCYGENEKWILINTAADVWGVGLILWELLSGKALLEHCAFRAIRNRPRITPMIVILKTGELLKNGLYAFFHTEPKEERSLAHLIWRCTSAEPSQRPNIQEVIQHYQAWAAYAEAKMNAGEIQSLHECFEVSYETPLDQA